MTGNAIWKTLRCDAWGTTSTCYGLRWANTTFNFVVCERAGQDGCNCNAVEVSRCAIAECGRAEHIAKT
eukprot:14688274-Alexandrium_andersonii.AAC.1